jgi:hypothetical protein
MCISACHYLVSDLGTQQCSFVYPVWISTIIGSAKANQHVDLDIKSDVYGIARAYRWLGVHERSEVDPTGARALEKERLLNQPSHLPSHFMT